jgi:hypothetical protein
LALFSRRPPVVPGFKRQPLKKLDPDAEALLKLLHRWRKEAGAAGRQVKRIAVAYESGRETIAPYKVFSRRQEQPHHALRRYKPCRLAHRDHGD